MEPDALLSGLHITDVCAHFSHSPQWGLGRRCLHSQSLPSGLPSLSQPTSASPLPGSTAAGAWCGPEHHQAELAPSHCRVSESRALASGAKHMPPEPQLCARDLCRARSHGAAAVGVAHPDRGCLLALRQPPSLPVEPDGEGAPLPSPFFSLFNYDEIHITQKRAILKGTILWHLAYFQRYEATTSI